MPKPLDPSKFVARGKPLSRPVLVGGTLQSAWVVPFATAAVLAAVGVVLYLKTDIPYTLALIPAGLVAAVPGAVAAAVQLARRRWMEVTVNGFVVTRRDGSRTAYDDEQIAAVSQQTWPRSDGGYLRRVLIEVTADGGGDAIECFYHVPPNTADPLYALVDRNVRGLAQRTADGLDRGARLDGLGWRYDRDGLHVHRGPARGTYPPDDLTYLAFYDGQIKVYRGADTDPLFCLPDTSANAHALGQLLWPAMEKRPGVNDPPAGQPLGRRMHTVRGYDGRVGWVLIGLFGAATAAFVAVGLVAEQTVMLVLGGLSLFLALLGVWCVWRGSYMRLDYHQFGVAQPGRGRSLRFEDLGTLRWTGTDIRIEPLPGRPGQVIAFHTTGMDFNHDRVTIRDYIAGLVAQRWRKELADGPVRWTASLRFLPDKLEYQPAGVFARGEPVAVPYAITSFFLIQTWMELFVQGEQRAVMKQPLNAANFYPGLILLIWLTEEARQQGQPAQQGVTPPKVKPTPAKPDGRFTGGERNVTPGE
ncbi:MAG: hypothetical protein ACRC33_15635 [Gemmataceae bacterium]